MSEPASDNALLAAMKEFGEAAAAADITRAALIDATDANRRAGGRAGAARHALHRLIEAEARRIAQLGDLEQP